MVVPESGTSISIGSRFDGVTYKLVWSRLENGRWTDPRVVTFGLGDDLAPVIGTSRAGSFLYWTDGRGRVLYAPFDPEFGRLFAAPRTLPLHGLGLSGPSVEGGSDAPIILGLCDGGATEPCVNPGTPPPAPIVAPPPPTGPAPEGTTDAPIILGTGGGDTGGTNATTLTAASALTCDTQILAVAHGKIVGVAAIDATGWVTQLGRFLLAPGVDPAAATAAAATYFHQRACN
jgi:hypothetical protein